MYSNKIKFTFKSQVKFAGNVTGILIPNTQQVVVRILGTIEPDGELFKQDLKFVPWSTVELSTLAPKSKIKIIEVEARSFMFNWTRLEDNNPQSHCVEACHKNVLDDLIQRGRNTIECRKM